MQSSLFYDSCLTLGNALLFRHLEQTVTKGLYGLF